MGYLTLDQFTNFVCTVFLTTNMTDLLLFCLLVHVISFGSVLPFIFFIILLRSQGPVSWALLRSNHTVMYQHLSLVAPFLIRLRFS